MQLASSRLIAGLALGLSLLLALVLPGDATAQSAAAVSDGTAFAKSLAPSSSKQIVNPTGVNPAAWTGNTSTPTAVPSSLGKFSAPNTSTDDYTAAKAIGLAGFGNQAVLNCSTYDPTTGDPTQVQTCAAVNFLSNRCLSPTTQQSAVMAANATAATPLASDCTGTYGQASASFGYSEAESSGDAIFGVIAGLPTKSSAATGETCTTQTVVVTPAQYAINTCTKNDSASEYVCYQYLNTSIQTIYTPATTSDSCTAPAVLQDGFCVSTTAAPAPVVYGCPPDQSLVGDVCQATSSTPASPVYSCPPGSTLTGSTCTGTAITPGTPSTTCPESSGLATGYSAGYHNATIDGVTGFCSYTYFTEDIGSGMGGCGTKFPAPMNGATLFYALDQKVGTGRGGTILLTTCYVTPEETCATGYTWNGSACQELINQAATVTGYDCSTGTLSGTQCVVTTSNPANPSYNCPTGTVLSGTDCVSSTSAPPNVSYSCPDGSAPVSGECITNYVLTSWVDTCGPYEASSGTTLPTPP